MIYSNNRNPDLDFGILVAVPSVGCVTSLVCQWDTFTAMPRSSVAQSYVKPLDTCVTPKTLQVYSMIASYSSQSKVIDQPGRETN